MMRMQVQLTARQVTRLRRAASAQGISLSELVRRLVDRGIEDELPDRATAYARASQLVGRFRDSKGAGDVSERHDDYLGDAYR
jgi:glucose-6-phosphate-specific signal transduction histidine kinase